MSAKGMALPLIIVAVGIVIIVGVFGVAYKLSGSKLMEATPTIAPNMAKQASDSGAMKSDDYQNPFASQSGTTNPFDGTSTTNPFDSLQ